jgi:hypothetical protein
MLKDFEKNHPNFLLQTILLFLKIQHLHTSQIPDLLILIKLKSIKNYNIKKLYFEYIGPFKNNINKKS